MRVFEIGTAGITYIVPIKWWQFWKTGNPPASRKWWQFWKQAEELVYVRNSPSN